MKIGLSPVVMMTYPIGYFCIFEFMNIDKIKTDNIDPVFGRVGAALVKCINAAFFAEIMFHLIGIPLIQRQQILTFGDIQVGQLYRGHNRPASPTQRTVASFCIHKCPVKLDCECHPATMTASVNSHFCPSQKRFSK
jgi:hypothetical protein